jgi:hypothetical protein
MPGGGWAQSKVTSYYGGAGENFGASIAISGNTTVVGANPIPCEFNCSCPPHCPSQLQGAAYVSPGSAQEQRLTASDGAPADDFGLAVAASDDTVAVGAPGALPTSDRTGVTYVFGPSVALGAPPRVRIAAAKINSKHHTAKFTFRAPGARGFQCALIKQRTGKHKKKPKPQFSRCKSPKTYKHLKRGRYRFLVRALRVGVPGTAASKNFKIS